MNKDNSQVTCLVENHVVATIVVNLGVVAANIVAVVELIADIKQLSNTQLATNNTNNTNNKQLRQIFVCMYNIHTYTQCL